MPWIDPGWLDHKMQKQEREMPELISDETALLILKQTADIREAVSRLAARHELMRAVLLECKHGAEYPDDLGDRIDAALSSR
jgi:hypothetical protein